jgi:hypothetical protein
VKVAPAGVPPFVHRAVALVRSPSRRSSFPAQNGGDSESQVQKLRARPQRHNGVPFGAPTLGGKPGQRVGAIDLDKQWDAVLLVLSDEDYEPIEIYEADRSSVSQALMTPGSRSRNERGQLGVSKFKTIGHKICPGP